MLSKKIFFVGLCAIMLIISYNAKKLYGRSKKFFNITNNIVAAEGYNHLRTFLSSETQKLTTELFKQFHNNQISLSELNKKLCKIDIEYSTQRKDLAKAYFACAKHELDSGNVFSAIKNASYSLEALSNNDAAALIASIISTEKEQELTNAIISDTKREIEILSELSNSEDKNIAAIASYRLALIHTPSIANYDETKFANIDKTIKYQHKAIEVSGTIPQKRTNISLVFNEKYKLYAKSTILSILLNSDLDNRYKFYAIFEESDPLSENAKAEILSLKKVRDFDIEFVAFPEKIYQENKELFKVLSQSNYHRILGIRLFLDKVLGNLERILQLDTDLIILRDLHDLATLDMQNAMIGAALTSFSQSEGAIFRSKECENLPIEYFNAGVMVQNLQQLSSTLVAEKAIRTKCDYFFYDQCALNIAANGKIQYISSRWNTIFAGQKMMLSPAEDMPFILHFTSINQHIKKHEEIISQGKSAQLDPRLRLFFTYYDYSKKLAPI